MSVSQKFSLIFNCVHFFFLAELGFNSILFSTMTFLWVLTVITLSLSGKQNSSLEESFSCPTFRVILLQNKVILRYFMKVGKQ